MRPLSVEEPCLWWRPVCGGGLSVEEALSVEEGLSVEEALSVVKTCPPALL